MRLVARAVELLLADATDVRHVAGGVAGGLAGWVVIALIEAQVLDHLRGVRALHDDRGDRLIEQLAVVAVGAGDHHPQRPAVGFDKHALLGPGFPSISWVWAPRATGEAALAQHPVSRLPLPAHGAQLVALGDQTCPDLLEHPVGREPLKPAVHGGVRAEAARQLVPLHPRPHPIDDPVQHPTQIRPRTPAHSNGIALQQDRLDPRPQLVRDLPDRRQPTRRATLGSWQGTLLSRDGVPCLFTSRRHNSCYPKTSRIVTKGGATG